MAKTKKPEPELKTKDLPEGTLYTHQSYTVLWRTVDGQHKHQLLGIIGDGQLGRMIIKYGIEKVQHSARGLFSMVLGSKYETSPAKDADFYLEAPDALKNQDAINALAEMCEVVTYEIEHISTSLMQLAGKFLPSPDILVNKIQNKYFQKLWLRNNKIPVADFVEINSPSDLLTAFEEFGPGVLKRKNGAYDGRGNFNVETIDDIEKAAEALGDPAYKNVYYEKKIPFKKELAVMVVVGGKKELREEIPGKKGPKGGKVYKYYDVREVLAYPVTETIHNDSILDMTITPPQGVSPEILEKAEAVAKLIGEKFDSQGLYGVEMFLTQDGEILVNEIAPRPHNSGHYTINATETSQFENLVKAILGRKLGSTAMKPGIGCAIVVNILGEENSEKPIEEILKGVEEAEAIGDVHVELYGKTERKKRKVGHFTVWGATYEEVLRKLNAVRGHLRFQH